LGHEISRPTLEEALSAVVTEPLMKSVRAVAWKLNDLKEQVERNNSLNAKIDAFGVHLHAMINKLADLSKVLNSTLAHLKK
jgi:hypothetical protein